MKVCLEKKKEFDCCVVFGFKLFMYPALFPAVCFCLSSCRLQVFVHPVNLQADYVYHTHAVLSHLHCNHPRRDLNINKKEKHEKKGKGTRLEKCTHIISEI